VVLSIQQLLVPCWEWVGAVSPPLGACVGMSWSHLYLCALKRSWFKPCARLGDAYDAAVCHGLRQNDFRVLANAVPPTERSSYEKGLRCRISGLLARSV
jgi:hypothetical protein